MTTAPVSGVSANRLLARLSMADAAIVISQLDEIALEQGHVLVADGDPMTHAYFPDTCVLSVINQMHDGSAVEMGTIGNEGYAGISIVLDAGVSVGTIICQVPGVAHRIPAALLVQACDENISLGRLLHRSTYAFLGQVGQTAACNARHDIEQRCARWLLMTHDRVGGADSFPLKQEYLAMMLGVRRTGVTLAAGALQDLGLIRYRRGHIGILDRAGLEARACECYRVVREQFTAVVA